MTLSVQEELLEFLQQKLGGELDIHTCFLPSIINNTLIDARVPESGVDDLVESFFKDRGFRKVKGCHNLNYVKKGYLYCITFDIFPGPPGWKTKKIMCSIDRYRINRWAPIEKL